MMTKHLMIVLCLALAAGAAWALDNDVPDVFLEATRPDFQKIPISVLWYQQDGAGAERPGDLVAEVLKADLRRSLVFAVTDAAGLGLKPNGSAQPAPTLLKEVSDRGVSLVVWGKVVARDRDLIVDHFLHDSAGSEGMVGKRYVGAASVLRLMAHRFADELVYRYTGEQGIARTKLAFVSEQGGSRELYVMDYDGYGPRQVTADGFINLMPRWWPDRRSLVFTSYRTRSRQDIVQLELATGKRTTLTSTEGLNITPSPSPDGSLLAFASSREGNSEVYVMNMQTKALQRLTFDPGGDLSPTWSPSGREIAFVSDRRGGPQIYLMGVDGSNVRRLTFDGDYNAAPAWSPKGDWIAYVCRTAERQYKLCLISPDGQKRVQITTGTGVDDSPAWSPDGRHLVFSSTAEGKSHIYMINRDGRDQERLTSGGTHHSSPAWSPT